MFLKRKRKPSKIVRIAGTDRPTPHSRSPLVALMKFVNSFNASFSWREWRRGRCRDTQRRNEETKEPESFYCDYQQWKHKRRTRPLAWSIVCKKVYIHTAERYTFNREEYKRNKSISTEGKEVAEINNKLATQQVLCFTAQHRKSRSEDGRDGVGMF